MVLIPYAYGHLLRLMQSYPAIGSFIYTRTWQMLEHWSHARIQKVLSEVAQL